MALLSLVDSRLSNRSITNTLRATNSSGSFYPLSLCVVDMADAMDVKAGLEALIQAAQFLEENGENGGNCMFFFLPSHYLVITTWLVKQ